MRNIKHPADSILWLALLLGLFICTVIVLVTAAYHAWMIIYTSENLPNYRLVRSVSDLLIIFVVGYGPFLTMIGAILLTERHLIRGRIPAKIYIFLLLSTCLALGDAFLWFQGPMHDIALAFGSHGRWGCGVVNADGSYYYFFRDATVPWMLYTPILLTTIAHWIWSRKHGRTEQSVPEYPPQGVGSSEP